MNEWIVFWAGIFFMITLCFMTSRMAGCTEKQSENDWRVYQAIKERVEVKK